MALKVLHLVCNALFFVAGSVYLGGLVLLAIATRFIRQALEKRRTEGGQIVRRLRGVFQRIELIALAALWAVSIALLVLEKIFGSDFPGTFGPVDAIKIGLLVVPTVAAAYSTFYLTGAIRRGEAQLGAYTDKNEQIKVRKRIALLHTQAAALVWMNAVFLAGVVVVAVVAMD